MFHRLLSHGMRIVSYVERKSKLWIPYVMPLLILLGYLEEALYSVWHLHVARGWHNPNPNLLASICQLLDISLILTGTVLTLIGWHAGSGCSMLLLHRLVQRFYSGMWITDLLEHFVDVGCLLLLLALRLSQRQRLDWCNNNNSSNKQQEQLQRYLLLGRIGLCCEFLLWLGQHASGNHHHPQHPQLIDPRWQLLLATGYILMLSGIRCSLMSSLAALCLLWHHWSWAHFFGWHDLTISIQLLSSLLGKVAGFVLLAHLGGGKWSLDTAQALHHHHRPDYHTI